MKDPPGILIVDDDAVTLRATSRILKSAGYQVTEAANGAECLRLAREQSPDLILLDVVLPDESGVQICQRLKADSQLANVFVVLLSGIQTDSDSRAQGLEAGADGYIARPIANRELVARVQALLRIKAAEDALRASEERFRTVADFTSDWEYWIGVDSKPVYVSPSCERITGYRTEEFMQDPSLLGAIIHPDDRALMDSHQRQVLTRDNSANFDFRIVTRGGEERWINHVCQPVYGTGGRWLGQRASNRDITDRKHAEEALRNAAREWKTTFDAVTDAVWLLDKEQRIVLANQATQRVFNLTPENIIGKHCWQVVHGTPEPIPECPIIRMQKSLHRESMELTIGERWVEVTVDPVLDEVGRYAGAVHIVSDITERKRAEEAVRALSTRHPATLAAIPDIIMEVDNNKVYTWANEAGTRFFGADVIGKSADFYFEGEQETYTVVQPLFNGNEDVIYVESWQRRHDGEKRLLGWWCRTLKDTQGNVTGALSTAHDITDRKRAEEALKEYSERLEQMVEERARELRDAQEQLIRQERLTVLGQLAGGIGHELRTPLGTIKNAVYLLRQTLPAPDADTRDVLDILDQQVEASNRTITSLLSFAHPQPALRRATDVRDVLDVALAPSALPASITVHQQYDAALPTLMADPDQLEIVFGNLIRNAVQAMPNGGQLTIATRASDDEVSIAFSDTGGGIAPEDLAKIFQPLFSTKARGLGIGLALCKLLVDGHHGRIKVTSQVGAGTTFVVCLPRSGQAQDLPLPEVWNE